MEQSNQKSNEDSEALRKEHEKMLEDDLNGIESKLTKQFLKDSAFIYNQINEGQSQKASLIPKKAEIKKKVPDGQLPRKYKIDQLTKKLDEEYFKHERKLIKFQKIQISYIK